MRRRTTWSVQECVSLCVWVWCMGMAMAWCVVVSTVASALLWRDAGVGI